MCYKERPNSLSESLDVGNWGERQGWLKLCSGHTDIEGVGWVQAQETARGKVEDFQQCKSRPSYWVEWGTRKAYTWNLSLRHIHAERAAEKRAEERNWRNVRKTTKTKAGALRKGAKSIVFNDGELKWIKPEKNVIMNCVSSDLTGITCIFIKINFFLMDFPSVDFHHQGPA